MVALSRDELEPIELYDCKGRFFVFFKLPTISHRFRLKLFVYIGHFGYAVFATFPAQSITYNNIITSRVSRVAKLYKNRRSVVVVAVPRWR